MPAPGPKPSLIKALGQIVAGLLLMLLALALAALGIYIFYLTIKNAFNP
jgi:hypothetical protein